MFVLDPSTPAAWGSVDPEGTTTGVSSAAWVIPTPVSDVIAWELLVDVGVERIPGATTELVIGSAPDKAQLAAAVKNDIVQGFAFAGLRVSIEASFDSCATALVKMSVGDNTWRSYSDSNTAVFPSPCRNILVVSFGVSGMWSGAPSMQAGMPFGQPQQLIAALWDGGAPSGEGTEDAPALAMPPVATMRTAVYPIVGVAVAPIRSNSDAHVSSVTIYELAVRVVLNRSATLSSLQCASGASPGWPTGNGLSPWSADVGASTNTIESTPTAMLAPLIVCAVLFVGLLFVLNRLRCCPSYVGVRLDINNNKTAIFGLHHFAVRCILPAGVASNARSSLPSSANATSIGHIANANGDDATAVSMPFAGTQSTAGAAALDMNGNSAQHHVIPAFNAQQRHSGPRAGLAPLVVRSDSGSTATSSRKSMVTPARPSPSHPVMGPLPQLSIRSFFIPSPGRAAYSPHQVSGAALPSPARSDVPTKARPSTFTFETDGDSSPPALRGSTQAANADAEPSQRKELEATHRSSRARSSRRQQSAQLRGGDRGNWGNPTESHNIAGNQLRSSILTTRVTSISQVACAPMGIPTAGATGRLPPSLSPVRRMPVNRHHLDFVVVNPLPAAQRGQQQSRVTSRRSGHAV